MKNVKFSERMKQVWQDPVSRRNIMEGIQEGKNKIQWSEAMNEALAALVNTSPPLSWEAIAHKMGMARLTVKRQCRALGLTKVLILPGKKASPHA